ncbi:uncharacterized protein TrAtP1_003782 [Trichoderma atroviride]|uniref:uncharacterized protein n=1 Tax=Hypocrea atroviridis TaxID=63577 RepID=UPI003332A941|nr:hypothetical protein TrAtP1_003782 [Trichoderma atroviride]
MLLGTCDDDWIHTSFVCSSTTMLSEKRPKHRVRAHLASVESCSQVKRSCFNETTIRKDYTARFEPYGLSIEHMSSMTLDHHLEHQQKHHPISRNPIIRLDLVSRKVVGLLLACSLFRLCGSPWIQHGFERESIYLFPHPSPNSILRHWCPHISCNLGPLTSPTSLSEEVAALGVLILELEANRPAGWTDDDEDYETETKSNRARLSRILKQWKGDVTNSYYEIGLACLSFDSLVENFEHPDIDKELKKFTILYKCIVNPLFQKLVSDFPVAANLFEGTSGLAIPAREQKAATSSSVVLYDDSESSEPDFKSQYAKELIDKLETSFLGRIKILRENPESVSLARALEGIKIPERIRIAVLDTGIDTTDMMIRSASGSRIKGKRSWVGSNNNFEDEYGHGTHVTRLLLKMAPAAEIFVAKITTNKTVDVKDMERIAEAIDCAVKEWKVHIISMSFGFEKKNQAIEAAIGRASQADILMFAAASNEGGNKKTRSRPGLSQKVICIHACDGKGNKGAMNPNPERDKYNFSALGVAVPSIWKKKLVYKSGTSFATPIAAAFAANILEFANFKCKLGEEDKKLLYRQDGMQAVFRAMSIPRDNYNYLQPEYLWDDDDDNIARKIQSILDEQ